MPKEKYYPHKEETPDELLARIKDGEILHIRFDIKDGVLKEPDYFKKIIVGITTSAVEQGLPLNVVLTAPDFLTKSHMTVTLHKYSPS